MFLHNRYTSRYRAVRRRINNNRFERDVFEFSPQNHSRLWACLARASSPTRRRAPPGRQTPTASRAGRTVWSAAGRSSAGSPRPPGTGAGTTRARWTSTAAAGPPDCPGTSFGTGPTWNPRRTIIWCSRKIERKRDRICFSCGNTDRLVCGSSDFLVICLFLKLSVYIKCRVETLRSNNAT